MNKVDLKHIFMNLQKQMISKLSTDREIIVHPGTKGDASELNWIEMLNVYLPNRYNVDKAFVLDSDGNLSEQIDLVIYDNQYSPFLFHQDNAKYIPAEGVYAVFEVKQIINKENVKYSGGKIKSVRSLKRTSAPIPHAGGTYEPKAHFEIIGGILSLDSGWKAPFEDSLSNALSNLEMLEKINIGCVLRHCGFTFDYETHHLDVSQSDDSLIFFFLNLLSLLQELGTTPALDIWEYGKFLK